MDVPSDASAYLDNISTANLDFVRFMESASVSPAHAPITSCAADYSTSLIF